MSSMAAGPTTPTGPRKGSPRPEPRRPPGGQADTAWTRDVSRNLDGARLPVTRADKDPGSRSRLVSLGTWLPVKPHCSSLENGHGSSPAAWQSRCEEQRMGWGRGRAGGLLWL